MARAAKKETPVAFTGFGKEAFTFLKGIAFYQSKQWYTENKPVYEQEVLIPMISLVHALSEEMQARGLPLSGDPKKSVFRLHRDVRFSKDKTPYKTHAAATLSRDGRKLSPGMLYVHIDPEGSFAAMGTYHPQPEELAALRIAIAQKQKRWLAILNDLEVAGLSLSDGEMLTRLPRGYDAFADSPVAESLRQRSFILRRSLPQSSVGSKKLIGDIADFTETGRKFLEFQWSAIDHAHKG